MRYFEHDFINQFATRTLKSMWIDPYKEWRLKNQFCTADDIDERQAMELVLLLDQWEAGEISPWEVLLRTSFAVGVHCGFLIEYNFYHDCASSEGARAWVVDQYRKHKGVYSTILQNEDPQSIADATWSARQKYREVVTNLKTLLRPEVLDDGQEHIVHENIKAIRHRLESGEFSSWDAARAIAEVIFLNQHPDANVTVSPVQQFIEDLEENRSEANEHKKDISKTLRAITSETEAQVKKPMALVFALKRAHEEYIQTEVANGKSLEEAKRESYYITYDDLDLPANDDLELIIPIDFPSRELCSIIEIGPSGTGLIQILDKDPHHSWSPTSVGRITTYSISFVAKTLDDIEPLKEILQKALSLLGELPYKYGLAGVTSSGEPYKRMSPAGERLGSDWEYYASNYIQTNGTRLSPIALFDLDDLWTLYYLMEPVIEPSAQIAAAMNAARYAEERGAILAPPDDQFGMRRHTIENESGYLKKSKPERILADAMADSLADFARNEIDEAEFAVRVSTLAHHTLMGSIADISGTFPTFNSLLEDRRAEGKSVITYEIALHERFEELLRCLIGQPKDSARPLYVALIAAVREIGKPLKEQSREELRHRALAAEEADLRRQRANRSARGNFYEERTVDIGKEETAKVLSDAFAKRARLTDQEVKERHKDALTVPTHLIVASSAVETAIDGIHHAHVAKEFYEGEVKDESEEGEGIEYDYAERPSYDGYYITRTKGSPHVRKELPEKLKPFCPQENHRPPLRMLKTKSDYNCDV